MTLDELKQIAHKKLPIDKEHLDTEALNNQRLYAEFIDSKPTLSSWFKGKVATTKNFTETSGNITEAKQMRKYMLQNRLTLKFSKVT